mmetsp:Transcript_258/g.539  ORF Transcript_258/g.539 Transcript_258/m.539 type:complete len:442 (+) Transcript_258:136-1461(+)
MLDHVGQHPRLCRGHCLQAPCENGGWVRNVCERIFRRLHCVHETGEDGIVSDFDFTIVGGFHVRRKAGRREKIGRETEKLDEYTLPIVVLQEDGSVRQQPDESHDMRLDIKAGWRIRLQSGHPHLLKDVHCNTGLDGVHNFEELWRSQFADHQGEVLCQHTDELGRFASLQTTQQNLEDRLHVWIECCLRHVESNGCQMLEAVLLVGLARDELLEDPQNGLNVGSRKLISGDLEVRCDQPDQCRDVSTALPKRCRQKRLEKHGVRLAETHRLWAVLQQLREDLEDVRCELHDFHLQDSLERREQQRFQLAHLAGILRAHRPDEDGDRFKQVMVELRISRILAHPSKSCRELVEHDSGDGDDILAGRRKRSHDAFHHVIVLIQLRVVGDLEESGEKWLEEWLELDGGDLAFLSSASHVAILRHQNSLDHVRSIRVNNHAGGA